jgi:hypothetical protein
VTKTRVVVAFEYLCEIASRRERMQSDTFVLSLLDQSPLSEANDLGAGDDHVVEDTDVHER